MADDSSFRDHLLGRTVGPCRIEALIGRGGMGNVYRAHHLRLDRTVALKVISPAFADSAVATAALLSEARAAARLEDPHIVQVYDANQEGDLVYVVMQYVIGMSLGQKVSLEGPLPQDEALRIMKEVAAGLVVAHGHGLVHRDIKPGNIMLCANGAVRILDFGLCAKAGDLTLAGPDAPIGTLDFMSPEQGLCAPPDPRMDLYSLGCTYYFALTGQPPFFSVRDDQIPLMHQYSPIPDVRVARREVRRAAAELISRLMAKDPKDRPSSAAELLHALNSDELSTPMESPIILLAPMAEKKPVVESDPASPAAESSAAPVALPSPLFVPPAPVARRNPLAAKLVAGTAFLLVFGRHWRGPGSADWAAAALFASGAVAYLFFQIDLAVFRRRASSFLGCAVVVLCAWFYGAAGLSRGLPLDVLVLAGVGMVAIGASLFVGLWNEAKSDLFVAAGLVVAGAAMLILAAASQSLPEATPWVSAISARLRGDWAIFVSSGGLWRWSGLLVLGLAWRMRRRRASGRPAWDRMIVNWNR